MTLGLLDAGIVVIYLLGVTLLGILVTRGGSSDLKGYFLAGGRMPWYALGLSNASGMFDVAGTIWVVYLLYVYGLKSIFIPWVWPAFNQIFLMMFMAAWLRRSGVITGAEWITFRFGHSRGARLSHLVIVVFALVTVLGYMAFGFLGIGKLAAQFLPWRLVADPGANDKAYALILVALTTLYAVKGGMKSVVITEVVQFGLMVVACIGVGWLAMAHTTPAQIAAATPEGWASIASGWKIGLDWNGLLPALNDKIVTDGYQYFQLFLGLALCKGVLQSLAGPAPNYDMQRILAARDPREASLMSGLVNVVIMVPRYFLAAGLTALALVYYQATLRGQGAAADFDSILPFTLANFVPVGLLGLLLAGLLAAFMSSFAAVINAAPAYVINDLYKVYVRPDAPDAHYVRLSKLACLLFVVLGTAIGLALTSINDVVLWITSALYGGYTAANVLKWFWWRINGIGYFCGMAVGIGSALLLGLPVTAEPILAFTRTIYGSFGLALTSVDALGAFPVLFLLCAAATVAASLVTRPDDRQVLAEFYRRTRPWGMWGPVREQLLAQGLAVKPNRDWPLDLFNAAVGLLWQTCLVAAPILLVLRAWVPLGWTVVAIGVCSLILKYTWYDRLARREEDLLAGGQNEPKLAAGTSRTKTDTSLARALR